MTGYGRGETRGAGLGCVVECASVNRKGLEVSCQLPRDLAALELKIRDCVRERVIRGRVNVVVQFPELTGGGGPSVDLKHVRRVVADLRRAQTELDLAGEIDISTIAAIPGIFVSAGSEETGWWEAVEPALAEALDAMVAMRQREGAALEQDLAERIGTLEGLAAEMEAHVPAVVQSYRELLQRRLGQAGLDHPIDPARLATEVAIFAERSDVSEELTRIKSHCAQFREKLRSAEPSGRALEFLAQELFRELNTLGAKAGDCALSRLVVDAKVELDKIREQTLNVE